MPSLIFNSALEDEARGVIDFDTDSFKALLVTVDYVPDKDAHAKRSNVTDELANGNGYTSGGAAAVVSVARDDVNDRVNITLGGFNFPAATITARGAVYYKSRGGAASADELVAYIDFGGNIVSTNGTFSVTASTIRKQN